MVLVMVIVPVVKNINMIVSINSNMLNIDI